MTISTVIRLCIATLATLSVNSVPAGAQQSAVEERAVILSVIDDWVDGIRLGRSEMLQGAFHKNATMTVVTDDGDQTELDFADTQAFISAVSSAHAQTWERKVWNPQVYASGPLAVVWAQYAFYIDGKISYCGVDSYQLVRIGVAWKIVHLVYTRTTSGCTGPDAD